jgi:hypothetical protein
VLYFQIKLLSDAAAAAAAADSVCVKTGDMIQFMSVYAVGSGPVHTYKLG